MKIPLQFSATFQLNTPASLLDATRKQYDLLRGENPVWVYEADMMKIIEGDGEDEFTLLMMPDGEVTLSTNAEMKEKSSNANAVSEAFKLLKFPQEKVMALVKQVMLTSSNEETLVLELDTEPVGDGQTKQQLEISDSAEQIDSVDIENEQSTALDEPPIQQSQILLKAELKMALSYNNSEKLRKLLDSGLVLHHFMVKGYSDNPEMTQFAAKNASLKSKKILREYGITAGYKLLKREKTLTKECVDAIRDNDLKAFIEAYIHPNFDVKQKTKEIKDGWDNSTFPLREAARLGRLNMVEALLNHPDVDVNQTMHWGDSALTYAAENGHYNVVARLLEEEGININQKSVKKTALQYAREKGHTKIVDLLLSYGAK